MICAEFPEWSRFLAPDQIRVVLAEDDPARRQQMIRDLEEMLAETQPPPPRSDAGGLGRRRPT